MNSGSPAISNRPRGVAHLCLSGLIALLIGVAPARSRGDDAPASGPKTGENGLSIEKVEIGLKGLYKVGEWTPFWVTVRSTEDREVTLVIDAPDPDDNLTSLPGRTFLLKSAAPQRCEACFRTGRMNGELQIQVRDAQGQTLAGRRYRATSSPGSEFRPALRLDQPLWLTLGKVELTENSTPPEAVGKPHVVASAETGREPRIARFDSPDELPHDWRALESVDLIILATSRPAGEGVSLLSRISAATDATLQNWVSAGGHLLISIGGETDAFQKAPLAKWIRPIVIEGQSPVRQLSSLEGFSGQNVPLKFSGTVTTAKFEKLPSPNVVLRHIGNPEALIASVPHGFGRVTVIGVDIDAPPVSSWKSLTLVVQKLAGAKKQIASERGRTANRQLTHVGVTDLATQFQQTHENFPTVRRPSYWWVMGLILIYVVVIGPLDYAFTHRVLRRPELTWLTFPVLVCAAIAISAWEANRMNARGLLVNQFDLVDIDTASGAVRAETWASLYSPGPRRVSVAIEPDVAGSLGIHLARRSTKTPAKFRWAGWPLLKTPWEGSIALARPASADAATGFLRSPPQSRTFPWRSGRPRACLLSGTTNCRSPSSIAASKALGPDS